MIGRTMLFEVEIPAAGSRLVVEVHRGHFSRLTDGQWVDGDDEDLEARGLDSRNVIAVIRNRVRAFLEDGAPLGRAPGFFEDQDAVRAFLEERGARVLEAVEV